jgi:hypothetical protein
LKLVHGLVRFLKSRPPHFMAPFDDVKRFLDIGPSIKKLFKHSEFIKYIKGDIRVLYR